MDEILSAIESLSLELQAADEWAWQAKLEKIKTMLLTPVPEIISVIEDED